MTSFKRIKEEIVPKDPQVAFPESMTKNIEIQIPSIFYTLL